MEIGFFCFIQEGKYSNSKGKVAASTKTYTYYFSNNVCYALWAKAKTENAHLSLFHELRFLGSTPSELSLLEDPLLRQKLSKSFLSVATENEVAFSRRGEREEDTKWFKMIIYIELDQKALS